MVTVTRLPRRRASTSFDLLEDIHALGEKLHLDHGGKLGIVRRKDVRALEDRHANAEAAIGLCQLAGESPAADHDQMVGAGRIVEDGVGGEMRRHAQTGQVRHQRPAAGRHYIAARAHHVRAGLHDIVRDKPAARLQDKAAKLGNALGRATRCHAVDHAAQVGLDVGKPDLRRVAIHAEPASPTHGFSGLRRRQQRPRRYGASARPPASGALFVDENGAGPKLRGGRGNGQPTGTGAKDADVSGDDIAHWSACPERRGKTLPSLNAL